MEINNYNLTFLLQFHDSVYNCKIIRKHSQSKGEQERTHRMIRGNIN